MPFEFQVALETLDEVPQNFRGLYSAGDSGFVLEPNLAKKLDVSGLTTALDKERKNNKAKDEMIKGWKALGETPEVIQQKIKDLEEAATATKDGKVNWDKMKAELENGHKVALTAAEARVSGMRKALEAHLVDAEATKEISDAKGASALLLPHVRSQVKVIEENGKYVVRIVDGDGDPRGDGKGGFMTIKDLVAEMKTSEQFGRAFDATGAAGSGKRPGSGGGRPQGGSTTLTSTQKIAQGLNNRK